MLDRPMFAFAQDGGAGEEDREHRNVVDDLVDRDEPTLLHIWVEARARDKPHQFPILSLASSGPKRFSFLRYNFLNIRWTPARLTHRGRVGDDLDRRGDALGEIVLKLGRNIDDEGVFALRPSRD